MGLWDSSFFPRSKESFSLVIHSYWYLRHRHLCMLYSVLYRWCWMVSSKVERFVDFGMHVRLNKPKGKLRLFNPVFPLPCCFSGVRSPQSSLSSPLCHASLQPLCVFPVFFHMELTCVMYMSCCLQSSLWNFTCVPISSGMLLISSAWPALSLCQSYASSHACARGSPHTLDNKNANPSFTSP